METASRQANTDVLVVGAGPSGLTAASEAARHGLSVRIVDRSQARPTSSRALVLHARTLEVFESLGCADAMLAAGQRFRGLHVSSSPTRPAVYVDLLERRWGDTRYPFWLSVPQYQTERVLEQHLNSLGGSIEWATELTRLEQRAAGVVATLAMPDGTTTSHRARWVLGCDGGRSATREQIGISLRRADAGVTFAIADLHTASALPADEGHVVLAPAGLLFIVPLPEPGLWRLIAQVPPGQAELSASDWNDLVQDRAGIDLAMQRLGWNSSFRLTSGVADRFRNGDVFLLGDAAHVHSPVGGQGLNTGVQDAHNLIWKLALSRRPGVSAAARETLLASYEIERRPIAQRMVRNTTRATSVLTSPHRLVRALLRRLAPLALRSSRLQDRLGRGVGMLDILTGGAPRLPNPLLLDGQRLHDRVDPRVPTLLHWQGKDVLVRPDRIVAQPGTLPHYVRTTV